MGRNASTHAARFPEIEWNWEKANYFPGWHEPIFSVLSRYIPERSRVLEVGAGGSHTLGAVSGRLNCKVFGIEPDIDGIAKTVELAENDSAQVSMVQGDGFCIPFANGQFDVVYSLGLIEHFSVKQSEELVQEHVRVCKVGGLIIIAVPNLANIPHTLRKWKLGSKYEFFPERSYTPRALMRLMLENDVENVHVDGVSPLWGLAMFPWAWRPIAALESLGVSKYLSNLKNPTVRAYIGYMTYAIGRKAAVRR